MVARARFGLTLGPSRRWRVPAVLLLLVAALVWAAAGSAAPRAGAPAQGPSLQAGPRIGGATYAASVAGGLLYVGVGPRLHLYGTAPGVPLEDQLLGRSAELPGVVLGVTPSGDRAYVALGAAGLAILDVSNPAAPRPLGQMAGAVSMVVVEDPYIYLVGGTAGVRIVDAANPAQPVELSHFGDFVNDLAVGGGYAYTVARNLVVWNLSDPANPRTVRELANWADGVALTDVTLYAATSEEAGAGERRGYLQAWDVSNPRRPSALGKVPLAGQARWVGIQGDEVWTLAGLKLERFDATDPVGIPLVGAVAAPLAAQEAAPAGALVYLAAGSQSLRGVALDGGSPAEGSRALDLPGRPETLALDGERLYVEDNDERILVYRAEDLAAGPLGALAVSAEDGALVAADGHLYVGTPEKQLRIFDVRDVAAIREVATLTLAQTVLRLAYRSGTLYLAMDPFLRLMDVRDPARPATLSQTQPNGGATDLAIDGRWLYVTGPNTGPRPQPSLKVLDVRNPLAPVERSLLPALSASGGVATAEDFVYVNALQVVEACVPAAATQLARISTPGRTHDIAVDGWRVYAAKRGAVAGGELQLIDVHLPRQPVLAASLVEADAVDDVVARGGAFWASAREAGLLAGRSPDVYYPTPTPDTRPTATRLPGVSPGAFLPLLRNDGRVRRCPAP